MSISHYPLQGPPIVFCFFLDFCFQERGPFYFSDFKAVSHVFCSQNLGTEIKWMEKNFFLIYLFCPGFTFS